LKYQRNCRGRHCRKELEELMDQLSQQRINEAAEQFTDALVESYKTVTERGASAQEQGAQLTEDFFNRVVENLRIQAEQNRQATQQLAATSSSARRTPHRPLPASRWTPT
jgi:hypothetical protein